MDAAASNPPSRFSDLRLRIVSALLLTLVSLAALLYGGGIWMGYIVFGALILAREWARLTRTLGKGWKLAGIPYILLPCLSLIALRQYPVMEAIPLLILIAIIAATDIGAYFTGRLIGGPKLAPTISPGKTWAGSIGGTVAALVVAAIIFLEVMGMHINARFYEYLAVTLVLSVAGQLGDLFESFVKRKAGVKDSGKIIPGHGGLFDRLDALLFAAPLLYGYMLWRFSA